MLYPRGGTEEERERYDRFVTLVWKVWAVIVVVVIIGSLLYQHFPTGDEVIHLPTHSPTHQNRFYVKYSISDVEHNRRVNKIFQRIADELDKLNEKIDRIV